MLKQLCALLVVAIAVRAQFTPLPYYLSLNENYVVTWGLTNDTIEIQLDVTTKGWVSFAILSDDGSLLDVWWGGFDEDYNVNYGQDGYSSFSNLTAGPRYPDTLQNLNLIGIVQSPFGETTRVRFTRTFVTPDFKQDVDIPFNTRQIIVWSYSNQDSAATPSVASGLTQMIFRPA